MKNRKFDFNMIQYVLIEVSRILSDADVLENAEKKL